MVILGTFQNRSLTISIKPNCLTISKQAAEGAEVYSFDNAGRLWTAMFRSVSYRRGLDGKIVAKWNTTPVDHERRWLTYEESRALEDQARQTAFRLYSAINDGSAVLKMELPQAGHHLFQTTIQFDRVRSLGDMNHYHQVYKPVGILPPDQYMAVVLQVTEGCSFNTCTFCNFYRDRPFRIKTPAELKDHIRSVVKFIGPGMSLRRTIFLGDANALVVPTSRLLALMDTINMELDVEKLGGIYAFLDGFSGEKKSCEDFIELKKRGLKRVYVGMESGSKSLLQFLKKPGKPEDVIHAVQTMKLAGVSVGIIVLLGAGGHTFAQEHIQDTIAAIKY